MKKVPIRKCVGCNERFEKRSLVRIVKSPENNVFVDLGGKANGRGCYICKNLACLEKAIKHKSLNRALECNIDEAVYEELKVRIGEIGNE